MSEGTAAVERCELASGFSVCRVLTGLWQIADMEREGDALDARVAAAAMQPYVNAGLTSFDMADHYGSAEVIAGHFAGAGATELLTKWVPKPGRYSKGDVREAVQRSLARLQRDSIDLLQFHAWRYCDPAWLDCMFELQALQTEGLIRHLGVTNFDADHLAMVLHSGIPVVSNQVCYSLLDRRPMGRMAEVCRAHGVKLLAFGTVAGGLLTERWLGAADPGQDGLRTWSQMKYYRFVREAGGWDAFQRLLESLDRVARRRGVSMANVACRFVLGQPEVAGIIVGARLGESEHIADNLRLFEFELDDEDRAALADGLSGMGPIPGDSGDEYRRPPYLTASGDLSDHFEAFPEPYPVTAGHDGRTVASSGTPWEARAGYGRAIRRGDRIWVSGTTASHGERLIGGDDPAAQTHFVIDKIEGAIVSLGGTLADVVRTRIFVQHEDDAEPIALVHGHRFGKILPANTLVRADLVGVGFLVEIEAEAVLG